MCLRFESHDTRSSGPLEVTERLCEVGETLGRYWQTECDIRFSRWSRSPRTLAPKHASANGHECSGTGRGGIYTQCHKKTAPQLEWELTRVAFMCNTVQLSTR